jgi:hypothetical protein
VKKRKLRVPSPALIVATCALVFSMAGTGYAVNQINGKTIKKGTISGKALKKNTLTGKEIKESKLGKVPSATTADNATNAANAANLAGSDANAFARNANFVRVFKTLNAGDPDVTLATVGDISVKMNCSNSGGSDRLKIIATTGTNGALLNSESDDKDPLNTDTPPDSSEIGEGLTSPTGTPNDDDGYDDTGFVISADSAHLITILEGSSTKLINRGGKTCTYAGTLIVE